MITKSKFSPRWWLRNPHFQTIAASKFVKHAPIASTEERIELPDGDFLDLNWSTLSSGPLVCLFHGLAGSINSAYATALFRHLETHGMRPVFMHWRGCSGEPNRLARSYHSGATDDIQFVVDLVRKRNPEEKVHAVGFSLGANALLKYLGEQKEGCPVSSAVAVCPPLVLSIGADKMNRGLAKGYQRYLIRLMREQHELKRQKHPELNLKPASQEWKSFWQFDNELTAPIHGFADVHDYYTQCSSRQYLSTIAVPTHILYALDDPFFTPAVVPTEKELSDSVTLELSDFGGHVGFIADRTNKNWLANHIGKVLMQARDTAVSSQ